MTTFFAYQDFKSAPHKIVSNRRRVKVFKSLSDLGAFLCSKENDCNRWHEGRGESFKKSGVYAFAGGSWHNVKTLDASALAHI